MVLVLCIVYTISIALFELQDMFSLDPRLFLTQTEGSGSRLIHVSHAEVFSYARERNKPGYVLTMTLKMKLHTKLHTATEDCIRYTKWGPINSAMRSLHASAWLTYHISSTVPLTLVKWVV